MRGLLVWLVMFGAAFIVSCDGSGNKEKVSLWDTDAAKDAERGVAQQLVSISSADRSVTCLSATIVMLDNQDAQLMTSKTKGHAYQSRRLWGHAVEMFSISNESVTREVNNLQRRFDDGATGNVFNIMARCMGDIDKAMGMHLSQTKASK